MKIQNIIAAALLTLPTATAFGADNWVTIRNGVAWTDDRGKSVQAHGGNFLQIGDTWYLIGEDRNNTWRPDVNMYSTKDFVNWKFERKIIENGVTHPDLGSSRFIERPKLMYNPTTKKFIVWCHWESSNYGASEAAVFQSETVNGAYEYVWSGRPLDTKSRDCTVFIDDDNTAYFVSTISENQHLGMFRLADDWLSPVEKTENFKNQSREAPAIVKVDNLYYMVSSACSGWAPNQAKLSTSSSVMSGWSSLSDIGNKTAYDTQASGIIKITGTEGTVYIYVGDRWQDPDLAGSKIIMFPVDFKDGKMTFNYCAEWDLDIERGVWRPAPRPDAVPKSGWKLVSTSSEETSSENAGASKAFDGDIKTFWHSNYSADKPSHPHDMVVDMGASYKLSGMKVTPRQDNINGWVRGYALYLSEDGENWGSPAAAGNWLNYECEVKFSPVNARYFRFVSLKSDNNDTYTTVAEIDMYTGDYIPSSQTCQLYWQVSGGSWNSSDNVLVPYMSTLKMGPQPEGSWAWTTPTGEMLTGREITISDFSFDSQGIYTAYYTDPTLNSILKNEYSVTLEPNLDKALDTLNEMIKAAEAAYSADAVDAMMLLEAINHAKGVHADYTDSDDTDQLEGMRQIYAEVNTLAEVLRLFNWANVSPDNPVDVTEEYILNPSFEEGLSGSSPIGWILDKNVSGWEDFKLSDRVPEGSFGENSFNMWAGKITSLDLHQYIELPKGNYTLNAALCITNDHITDQHVYVTVDGKTITSSTLSKVTEFETLSVNFMVNNENTKVRIGAASTGNGNDEGGWFNADDFTLKYKGRTNISSVIDVMNVEKHPDNGVFYDILGRPVKNPSKGIYIKAGRKVLVK